MHFGAKKRSEVGGSKWKVISTEIIHTLEVIEITKSKKIEEKDQRNTFKRQENKEKEAKDKRIVRETGR